jgi:hypothetical protein
MATKNKINKSKKKTVKAKPATVVKAKAKVKKPVVKKVAVKKIVAKKTTVKKVAAKKSVVKKSVAKKTVAKKTVAKKITTKKAVVKKKMTVKKTVAVKKKSIAKKDTSSKLKIVAKKVSKVKKSNAKLKVVGGQESAERQAAVLAAALVSPQKAIDLANENAKSFGDIFKNNSVSVSRVASKSASDSAKNTVIGEEIISPINDLFEKNVKLSQEFVNCSNIQDMFELQNEIMANNIKGVFSSYDNASNLFIDSLSQASEPTYKNLSEIIDELSKSFVA